MTEINSAFKKKVLEKKKKKKKVLETYLAVDRIKRRIENLDWKNRSEPGEDGKLEPKLK